MRWSPGGRAVSEEVHVDYVIRPATVSDALGIARVHTIGWQQGYQGLLPAQFLADRLSEPSGGVAHLSQLPPRSRVFVAQSGDQIVGFSACGPLGDAPDAEVTELHALYVLADHWGNGAGFGLHQACVTAMVELSYREARLQVLAGNDRAVDFYLRQGWRDMGHEDQVDIGGVVATVRQLSLALAVSEPQLRFQSSSGR